MREQLESLIKQMTAGGILYDEARREFNKQFILQQLRDNQANQCRAARKLGMHRNTLSRTIHELEIDIRELRQEIRYGRRSSKG